jgi:hypothetical protein
MLFISCTLTELFYISEGFWKLFPIVVRYHEKRVRPSNMPSSRVLIMQQTSVYIPVYIPVYLCITILYF